MEGNASVYHVYPEYGIIGEGEYVSYDMMRYDNPILASLFKAQLLVSDGYHPCGPFRRHFDNSLIIILDSCLPGI